MKLYTLGLNLLYKHTPSIPYRQPYNSYSSRFLLAFCLLQKSTFFKEGSYSLMQSVVCGKLRIPTLKTSTDKKMLYVTENCTNPQFNFQYFI